MSNIELTQTPFSQLLQGLKEVDSHLFGLTVSADWLQGRTAYGGLSSALCLAATHKQFPTLPPLRSAQFMFAGPATGDLLIAPTVLRQGKSTVFTSADLIGEDGFAARATFCFGTERSVEHDHAALPMPQVAAPEDCPPYFNWPGQPSFRRHFEGKLAGGAGSHTPAAKPEMLVWLRHRDRSADAGLVSLLALADAPPPAAGILFGAPTPLSTVSWSIDLLTSDITTQDGWWFLHCAADAAQAGFSAQSTTFWNASGHPIMVARQSVAIFTRPKAH